MKRVYERSQITRSSLGQIGKLGEIYDERIDKFTSVSLFSSEVPSTCIEEIKIPFLEEVIFLPSDSWSDKIRPYDINSHYQLSLLSGILIPNGSWNFLTDYSERSIKSSIFHTIKTKTERIDVNSEELIRLFDRDVISQNIGTHVLVGITLGFNTIFSAEIFENSNINRIVKENVIKSVLQKILCKINSDDPDTTGNIKDDKTIHLNELNSLECHLKIHSDAKFKNKEIPCSFEDVYQFFKRIPDSIKESNISLNKQLSFTFAPLVQIYELVFNKTQLVRDLDYFEDQACLKVLEELKKIHLLKNRIFFNLTLFKNNMNCISRKDFRLISCLEYELNMEESDFRIELAKKLVEVRSGRKEVNYFDKYLQDLSKINDSRANRTLVLTNIRKISSKIIFIQKILKYNVIHIGFNSESLASILEKYSNEKKNILYFSFENKEIEKWARIQEYFLRIIQNVNSEINIAVDLESLEDSNIRQNIRIETYDGSMLISSDVIDKVDTQNEIFLARNVEKTIHVIYPPKQKATLLLPCPNNLCKSQGFIEWLCFKCMYHLEFGFDDYFYCKCGKGLSNNFEFLCSEANHAAHFLKFDNYALDKYLKRLIPHKEFNILLLGETGVGKSTWINSFYSYLFYESLEEAEKGRLMSLIPTEFTLYRGGNLVKVTTGNSVNECLRSGQSATQKTRIYPFTMNKTIVRLIDTPGVGDIRGFVQDSSNFQNILNTLSYLDELHGICILLKPKESQLAVIMKFCIKELLKNLNKDAKNNIIFCFTNSRGTFYQPADTFVSLNTLLLENPDIKIRKLNIILTGFD